MLERSNTSSSRIGTSQKVHQKQTDLKPHTSLLYISQKSQYLIYPTQPMYPKYFTYIKYPDSPSLVQPVVLLHIPPLPP